ncbi:bifunctional diaminohydroxyphosphoribosylaminopyrimidine deaminase/5-amino-6-(5-phosphoribosylamino)uracil reductase RibD [Lacibacter luteus]|uniref:Riboflavin biosynthesis protein RibD n=1 Tax=Lacibacter luteus TaxID=2508719 RepID=A0A4Q1CMR1_9BACT|nr:bifunctional diaminohydroxyphosphoribosylaminopyrimidine deaminase/5-amino-6-(5-phosphoribosylamino)uracil reductase RibD [Lacibacter luteus]RXK62084.1 bifunctional diaminohydroxyphosphoribosylaminopyrimidine deaminase/5-amino-6-(5-phosphoribosylamino)uracil reductase RibD [Lacibacter luteus]
MTIHEQYMQRCIELARNGAGSVAPNPMVGAVLVHDGKIIGEGWHQRYGEAHAEVNCIGQATQSGQTGNLQQSTLYVSLEPCAHFGKTPPCSDLIIKHKIPKVVIGCRDPFEEVNGKGIEKLKAAGLEVIVDVLKEECVELNKRFFTFHQQQRPYVILKWAQTKNGIIGFKSAERLRISNEFTNRLVHQWRSEEAAILVGSNTALLDNPQLSNRYWDAAKQPVRLVVDRQLKLSSSLKLFNGEAATIVLNNVQQSNEGAVQYEQLSGNGSVVQQVLQALHQRKLNSVLVEGGAELLQHFINEGLWDEARIITNEELIVTDAVKAPLLQNELQTEIQQLGSDKICWYKNKLQNPIIHPTS